MDPRQTGGACQGAHLLSYDQAHPIIDQEMYAAPSDAYLPIFGSSACTPQKGAAPICYGQTSCGKCFELRCKAQFEVNNRGARNYADQYCKKGKSVKVKVIDACPKNHGENDGKSFNPCAMSDHPHLDIAEKAFVIIADKKAGIIWGEVREIPCDQLGEEGNGYQSFGK